MRLDALFGLAFAPAPLLRLTSPHTVTRWLILQKARHRGRGRTHDDALTDCKPTVSGTVSLPSRGAFHLSLTVLVRYRSPACTQPYEVVLADSHGLSRIPCYSGTPPGGRSLSCTGPLPSVARLSRTLPLGIDLVTPRNVCRRPRWVPRPRRSIAGRLYHCDGLGSSRFARRYSGSRGCFPFLGVLRCFNSPGALHRPYVFRPG